VIPQLDPDPRGPFPPPEEALAEPDGLLAWGGDLCPERLVNAYSHGVFPWYSPGEPILWWCPSVRCMLRTGHIHVARRLARTLRQGQFHVTADRAFTRVIDACATRRPSTWITPGMQRAYCDLHGLRIAHSVEVWQGGSLAGGLYGIALGAMFFGESMYSDRTDASKIALVSLCRVLSTWGQDWMDCQVCNPHLERLGAVAMPRAEFLAILADSLARPARAGAWGERFEEALGSVDEAG